MRFLQSLASAAVSLTIGLPFVLASAADFPLAVELKPSEQSRALLCRSQPSI